jgi:hypothetical protein
MMEEPSQVRAPPGLLLVRLCAESMYILSNPITHISIIMVPTNHMNKAAKAVQTLQPDGRFSKFPSVLEKTPLVFIISSTYTDLTYIQHGFGMDGS